MTDHVHCAGPLLISKVHEKELHTFPHGSGAVRNVTADWLRLKAAALETPDSIGLPSSAGRLSSRRAGSNRSPEASTSGRVTKRATQRKQSNGGQHAFDRVPAWDGDPAPVEEVYSESEKHDVDSRTEHGCCRV